MNFCPTKQIWWSEKRLHHSRIRIMQSMHMGPRTLVGHAHPTHGHPPWNSHTCTNLGPLVTRGQFGSRFRSILPNHPSLFDFRVGSLGRRPNPGCRLGLAPRRLVIFEGHRSQERPRPLHYPTRGGSAAGSSRVWPPGLRGGLGGSVFARGGVVRSSPPFFVAQLRLSV